MPEIDPREAIFERIIGFDPVQPFYYSYLFTHAKLLFDDELVEELNKRIRRIEDMVDSDLYVILNVLESNIDLSSYFKKRIIVDNKAIQYSKITKFEMLSELEHVRVWIFQQLKTIKDQIRFQRAILR